MSEHAVFVCDVCDKRIGRRPAGWEGPVGWATIQIQGPDQPGVAGPIGPSGELHVCSSECFYAAMFRFLKGASGEYDFPRELKDIVAALPGERWAR